MGAKIFATVALTVTLGFVAFNTMMLDRMIGDVIIAVGEMDINGKEAHISLARAKDIYEDFKTKELFMGMTVSHEDLTAIETGFSEMIGYLSVGDRNGAEVTKSRLLDALGHLRRLTGINIESVI